MPTYPILFGFRDAVAGSGFVATVAIDGRVLMVNEDGGVWFYGVEPGGVAGYGGTAQEAHEDFRTRYRSVLDDIAEEASDFSTFKIQVEDFLCTVNEPTEALWKASAKLVGDGHLDLEWLPQRPVPRKKIQDRIRIEQAQEKRRAINNPDAGAVQLAKAA